MATRGNIPSAFDRRSVQASGMMRHGPFSRVSSSASHPTSLEPLPHQMVGDKIAAQEAEIKELVGDNRRLASTHVALREELVNAQQEVHRLKAHIRSIQTESDIQIRLLLDKISKLERDIIAGENVKKELKLAHIEAQSLAVARQELKCQIERSTQELKKLIGDVKTLPDLQNELDNLVQEHQRLRATFEYEKNKNIELVEQLKGTEKNLIGMAREVEFLRAEIQNAEKKTQATNLYGAAAVVPSTFIDGYRRAEMGETPMANGSGAGNGSQQL